MDAVPHWLDLTMNVTGPGDYYREKIGTFYGNFRITLFVFHIHSPWSNFPSGKNWEPSDDPTAVTQKLGPQGQKG